MSSTLGRRSGPMGQTASPWWATARLPPFLSACSLFTKSLESKPLRLALGTLHSTLHAGMIKYSKEDWQTCSFYFLLDGSSCTKLRLRLMKCAKERCFDSLALVLSLLGRELVDWSCLVQSSAPFLLRATRHLQLRRRRHLLYFSLRRKKWLSYASYV